MSSKLGEETKSRALQTLRVWKEAALTRRKEKTMLVGLRPPDPPASRKKKYLIAPNAAKSTLFFPQQKSAQL